MAPRLFYPSPSRANMMLVVFFVIHLVLIRGVNSRPSPDVQDAQGTRNSVAQFEEQDETYENHRSTKEDILKEIMDVLEYSQYGEREKSIHKRLPSGESSTRVHLQHHNVQDDDESDMMGDMPIQDDDESDMMGDMPVQDEDESDMVGDMPVQDEDEGDMMGDMPVQDENAAPRAVDPIENINRRSNFFSGTHSGSDGMDRGGAIRQIIVRAPTYFNHSNDRESFLEELGNNMSLSTLNASTGLHRGNATTSSLAAGADAGAGTSAGTGASPLDPSAYASMQKTARESQEFGIVERSRDMRLKAIKQQILSLLGMLGRPQAVDPTKPTEQMQIIKDMVEQLKNQTVPRADIYLEKVQSFYPSCDVPKNTDEDLWNDAHAMNLLFDLNTPMVSNGTIVNVIAAKLRIYKLSQTNSSVLPGALCAPLQSDPEIPAGTTTPITPTALEEDQKIRVSVYWYTRSLKKNKLKRKLLDSKMLSVHGDEWTEFNVKQAAIEWRNKLKPNRNFGLVVEVENEDNVILPAAQYLSAMNCSKEAATARPIPGFLVDAARYYILGSSNRTNDTHPNRNASFDFNNSINYHSYLFPMIDLCTNEVPVHEAENAALYIHAQQFAQHSVEPEEHPRTGGLIKNTSDAFQQYQKQGTNESVGDGEGNDGDAHQSVGNNEPRDGRAMRHPRRPQENTAHRRRHHHGEPPVRREQHQGEQAKWLDPNGFQLRKQIIQKVILTQQRDAADSVRTDDR